MSVMRLACFAKDGDHAMGVRVSVWYLKRLLRGMILVWSIHDESSTIGVVERWSRYKLSVWISRTVHLNKRHSQGVRSRMI